MFDDEKCCFVRKESVLLMMDRSLEEKKKKESIFVKPATPYHSSRLSGLTFNWLSVFQTEKWKKEIVFCFCHHLADDCFVYQQHTYVQRIVYFV
jgi:hypothetical protein